MSLARTFAVVVLASLLTATLVTANVTAVAHLTVLDPDFVTDSIDEEGGYELVENASRRAITQQVGSGDGEAAGLEGLVDTTAVVDAAVSEAYLRSQTEANVDRAYAYFHGETGELNLSIATAPIRENVSAELEAQLRNASVAALVERSDATLPGPVNATVLERLTANESSYEAVRTDVRAEIRDRVLDAAVDRAFANRSNDELLALVIEDYDPREYTEEEKARMVDDRESEIRAALRTEIEDRHGEEINSEVDRRLESLADDATPEAGTETGVANATVAVQRTLVEGLTGDQSYDAFRSDLADAKAEFAAAAADRIDAELATEMPARVDLTETMSPSAKQSLEQVRTGVQWLDRLTFVLPALAAVLVGLVYLLKRSVPGTARTLGTSLLFAGLPPLVGVELARSRLSSLVAETSGQERVVMELAVGFVERILATVTDVSTAFVVAGAVLVVAWLAARFGLFAKALDAVRGRGGGGDVEGGV